MSSQASLLSNTTHTFNQSRGLRRYIPSLDWLLNYERENLSGDVIAAIIVAIMLIPQSMAYALLAGLPAKVGLYASIVPLIMYGIFGTSRVLSVGPAAMVSLMVASGIGTLNPANAAEAIEYATILATQIAIIQVLMGLLRIGFLVNFLSHPVLSGFTSAAGIIIGTNQLKHLLGLRIENSDFFYEPLFESVRKLPEINLTAVALSALSIGILLIFKLKITEWLKRFDLPDKYIIPISKMGPLVVVAIGTLLVWGLGLNETHHITIVGDVPGGLPPLTAPGLDINVWQRLFPIALAISLVGFMESISVAKSLASKKRQKIDPNQELIALGVANIGSAFTGGYPVAGGLSRSVVNYTAGANTGLASIITAGLIGITVLFFTPIFYYLPNAVLASIIIVAVYNLIDFKSFNHTLKYDHLDALSLGVTFFTVLFMGIEQGILIGAATAIGLHLWRTSRPHIAIIGRIGNTEHYRNILRHNTHTEDHILAIRVDESLYFPNMQYLESCVLGCVADDPHIDHLLLVCSAVNFIDSSALETLESLKRELNDAGVEFHMAEVKGPVMDRLEEIGFVELIGHDHIHLSTHQAMQALTSKS